MLALAGGLALAPGEASARAKTALHWVRGEGAESCIGPRALARAVEQHIGPVLVSATDGEVSVEGRIERADGGFVVNIRVSDAEGQMLGRRHLTGASPDCRSLDAEIAFVIAVAIDPDGALAELPGELSPIAGDDPGADLLRELGPPQPRKPTAPSSSESPAARRPDPAAPPTDDGSLSLRVGATVPVGVGVLERKVSVGARLTLELDLTAWALLLEGGLWSSEQRTLPIQNDARVSLSRQDVGLSVCPLSLSLAALRLQPCGGVLGSRVAAEHAGFVGNDVARFVLGPRLLLRASLPLWSRLEASLQVDVTKQWPALRFSYGPDGIPFVAHESAALTAALSLGVAVRF